MTTAARYIVDPGVGSLAVLEDGLFEITNHCALAKAKLLEQFKTKPRIESILCDVYIAQVQDLETALYDLITERTLDNAVGAQLDILGEVIGQGRLGLDDDDYRALLKARVLANRSDGQAETLIGIMVLVYGVGADITLTEPDPASVRIVVLTESVFDPEILFGVLMDAKSAGVRLVYVYIEQDADETFQFASGAVSEFDADEGFGDSGDPDVGGGFAGALSS